MKQFIKEIVLFSFLLLLLFFGLNKFSQANSTVPPHYPLQFSELNNPVAKANAIIIGTSHGTHSIIPDSIDNSALKFFNFSLNGAGPSYYQNWYQQVYKKNYSIPDVCIYVVDWFMLDEDYLWRNIEQDSEFFSSSNFIKLLLSGDLDYSELVKNRFSFFKNRKELFGNKSIDETGLEYVAAGYSDGYIPLKVNLGDDKFTPKELPEDVTVDTQRRESLENLIQLFRKDGVQLIFLMAPEYGIDEESYKGPSMEYLTKISTENEIPFLNFNTTLRETNFSSDRSMFCDWGHLSEIGSRKFSSQLGSKLLPHLN